MKWHFRNLSSLVLTIQHRFARHSTTLYTNLINQRKSRLLVDSGNLLFLVFLLARFFSYDRCYLRSQQLNAFHDFLKGQTTDVHLSQESPMSKQFMLA